MIKSPICIKSIVSATAVVKGVSVGVGIAVDSEVASSDAVRLRFIHKAGRTAYLVLLTP